MPEADIDHLYDYAPDYCRTSYVQSKPLRWWALVATRPSSAMALRVLHETGYDMIPVNPNPNLTEIADMGKLSGRD